MTHLTDPSSTPQAEDHAGPAHFGARRSGPGLPSLPRAAWVEVDLDAIVSNVRLLRDIAGKDSAIAAVVKADAYGHGIETVALAARAAGAAYLSVATLDEALLLRDRGDQGPILINYPIPGDALVEAADAGIEVSAGSDADVDALAALGARAPMVHLELDSGMGRGGFAADVLTAASQRLVEGGVQLRAVWSHLSAPEDRERTAAQVRVFEAAVAGLRAAGIDPPMRHLCASGGLLCGAPAYELARVGLALYGLHPCPLAFEIRAAEQLRPALSVKAQAVRITHVEMGTTVGYASAWIAPRRSRIATLPIGYADGWLRGAGPETRVLVRGMAVPVVGRISSDSMTVDVTDVPDLEDGDVFVLLGRDRDSSISADDIAASRGTISWEVLQTLSRRLPRLYSLGREAVAIRRTDRDGVEMVPDLRARLHAAAESS